MLGIPHANPSAIAFVLSLLRSLLARRSLTEVSRSILLRVSAFVQVSFTEYRLEVPAKFLCKVSLFVPNRSHLLNRILSSSIFNNCTSLNSGEFFFLKRVYYTLCNRTLKVSVPFDLRTEFKVSN